MNLWACNQNLRKRRPRPKSSLCVVLLLSYIVIGQCNPKPRSPSNQPTLTVGIPSDPLNLDPRIGTDKASYDFHRLIFSGLLQRDRNDRLVPDLAQEWTQVNDREFRFLLRSDAKFHDGRTVTARDVAWTYRSILNGIVPTPKVGSFRDIESIQTQGDRIVVVRLRRPNASFLINLTLGIVPEGSEPGSTPLGSGPFRWVEGHPGRYYLLERNFSYYGPRAKVRYLFLRVIPDATIRWLEMRKGSVDLIISGWNPSVLRQVPRYPHLKFSAKPSTDVTYMTFQLKHPVLRHPEVRRAIAMALDRNSIIRYMFESTASIAESLLSPLHWAYSPPLEPLPYDPQAASHLLDSVGFPDPDGTGPQPRFTLTLKTSTNPFRSEIAQVIQDQLKHIGIHLRIQTLEWGTFYYDITHGNFDLFVITRVGISDPDIFTLMFHSLSIPPTGANRGYYSNPELDKLLDFARSVYEPQSRVLYYKKIQSILLKDLPCYYLWYEPNIAIMKKEVKGFDFYPNGDYFSLIFVTKETKRF